MPTSQDISDWVANYFAANQQRVANILAGPKRETWFSAETFVALSAEAKPSKENVLFPDFSCWGEEEFSTVFNKVCAQAGIGHVKRKPDLVCYLPEVGADAIDTILELKLILNSENAVPAISELKTQLENARKLAPK